MPCNSKYQLWHDQIIARANSRTDPEYYENHHIQPKCFGGSDAKGNLVKLTYREHFLVHWLLTKITVGNAQKKMLHALHMMSRRVCSGRVVSGWQYEIARQAYIKAFKGYRHSEETKNKLRGPRALSDETRRKLRENNLRRPPPTEDTLRRIGAASKGRSFSAEARQKISTAGKGRRFSDSHKKNIGIALAKSWASRKAMAEHEQH